MKIKYLITCEAPVAEAVVGPFRGHAPARRDGDP